jgi:hypothetical protein
LCPTFDAVNVQAAQGLGKTVVAELKPSFVVVGIASLDGVAFASSLMAAGACAAAFGFDGDAAFAAAGMAHCASSFADVAFALAFLEV